MNAVCIAWTAVPGSLSLSILPLSVSLYLSRALPPSVSWVSAFQLSLALAFRGMTRTLVFFSFPMHQWPALPTDRLTCPRHTQTRLARKRNDCTMA
jgi:hypothetical protein